MARVRGVGMHLTPYEPQAIDGFVANVPNKTKLSLGIKQSFAFVAAMVKARPCLKIDFQVYLRNDGAVLNIDLDRCEIPVRDEEKLRLAQFPGLCGRHSTILVNLQLYSQQGARAAYGRLLSSATKPAKVARPSRKAAKNSSSVGRLKTPGERKESLLLLGRGSGQVPQTILSCL